MDRVFIEAFAIGFVGAILFLAVDMFERNSLLANLLRVLVLVVGGMAILHKWPPRSSALRCFSAAARTVAAFRAGVSSAKTAPRPLHTGQ
jgi:hypothetical protein